MAQRFSAHLLACLLLGTAAPVSAALPPPTVATQPQIRGLECTGEDRALRQLVIDFTAGTWREAGQGWSKIVQQDDATVTLVKEGGLLSGMSRLERLDRSTLILSTELHTGLIDQKQNFKCKLVPPFNEEPKL